MLDLLASGQTALFFILLIALVIAFTFHEWGHAVTAVMFGDDTPKLAGRLTLNPLAHLDPMGILMVILVGFGWARPVPFNPYNFRHRWADFFVSGAGPFMNLVLAFVSINLYVLGKSQGMEFAQSAGFEAFISYFAVMNMILMVFNLIPLGPLDGHYMMPYLLPKRWGVYYTYFNERYGSMALMSLVLLSMLGVPVFRAVMGLGHILLEAIIVV
ncbi:MAG: site-2 protease family protein [Deltaproteobacteria bacterium]|nr:site-2 protease family protein [Deltaproteobacteria bacterium]